jgi:hypothetical protein
MRLAVLPRMDRISSFWLVGLAATLSAAIAPRAAAAVRLVASGDLVAVIEGGEVRIFSADGRLLDRLGSAVPGPPAGGARAAIEGEREGRRERAFDLFDIPTELRDSQEAEDLVEDELPLAHRRREPATANDDGPGPGSIALAAPDDRGGLWVVVGGHLLGVDPERGTSRRADLPGTIQVMAAAGDNLLLASPDRLLASPDGGRTFAALLRLDRPVTRMAADPQGRWIAWASRARLQVLRGRQLTRFAFAAEIRDLVACGGHLVLLTDEGIHVGEEGGPPVLVSGPLPATGVSCPRAGPGPWLFAGQGLYESRDRGRTVRPRDDAPAGPFRALALARDRIWLVSANDLHALPADGQRPLPGPASAPTLDPAIPHPPAPWKALLAPRLTLTASYRTIGTRRDWLALALAELPLGEPGPKLRAAPAPVRRLALADPPHRGLQVDPPLPSPPLPPPASPVSPPAASWASSPYPPPDPDAGCLAPTRSRAVAAALAEAERGRSLVGRAGHAAWLPELRLLAQRRMGRSESLDVRTGAGTTARDALGLDASNDVRYEVRVTWDLPRLIFSPEETAAVQQALRMADMRREIEAQVNRVYFERRRLLVTPTGIPPAEATGALLRVEELEAELDALSAGEFSRCRGAGASRLGP